VISSVDVVSLIREFNAGRDPERLAMKYQKMRFNEFAFMRGTCHLFYNRLTSGIKLRKTPLVWVCGDLHLENFGSYKGSNREVYFDLNDFDEASLAPAGWDLVRMLTSIEVGALGAGIKQKKSRAATLCRIFVDAYAHALVDGKTYWLERETATGPIHQLLSSLRERKRSDFLDSRTENKDNKRVIRIDGKKALAVTSQQRTAVTNLLVSFAKTRPTPEFYHVEDVARRIAGTGSLGLDRFIVLINGEGGRNGNYLLDLKLAVPSSLKPYLTAKQPTWINQAQRVVELQKRIQAVPMAFLNSVEMDGASYVLRALQPSEDRISISGPEIDPTALGELVHSLGQMVAWAHLRTTGRQGSSSADDLIGFGQKKKWKEELLSISQQCACQVRADANAFNKAYDGGALNRH
jgi:uncharacterized protein (DUF2252 family)